MSAFAVVWVSVCCDRCLLPGDVRAGPARPLAHLGAARADLSGPSWGWEASTATQMCARCVRALVCQNRGHDWEDWQPHRERAGGDTYDELALRVCVRCGQDDVTARSA